MIHLLPSPSPALLHDANIKHRPQAHAGGCCSLCFQPAGHLVASCGMDKTVQTWDLNTASHAHTYHVRRSWLLIQHTV
jgi:WD40 repeat protein